MRSHQLQLFFRKCREEGLSQPVSDLAPSTSSEVRDFFFFLLLILLLPVAPTLPSISSRSRAALSRAVVVAVSLAKSRESAWPRHAREEQGA